MSKDFSAVSLHRLFFIPPFFVSLDPFAKSCLQGILMHAQLMLASHSLYACKGIKGPDSYTYVAFLFAVCGDGICSAEIGETCQVCAADCCGISFPLGATAGIVVFCLLIPTIVVVAIMGVRHKL